MKFSLTQHKEHLENARNHLAREEAALSRKMTYIMVLRQQVERLARQIARAEKMGK